MRRAAAMIGSLLAVAGAAHAEPIAELAARQAQPLIANRALIAEIEGMTAVEDILRRQFLTLRKNATEAERKELDAVWVRLYEPVDLEHTERLKALVKGREWFTISEIGEHASSDALDIANHSPDDAFQKEVVAMVEKLPPAERPSDFANIWDRVAVGEGRLQRYGTQGTTCAGGRYAQPPVEDAANLDKRRAEMGLQPMAEYLVTLDKLYGACVPPPVVARQGR